MRAGLEASLEGVGCRGIAAEAVVLDPGYGFGKRFEENFACWRGRRNCWRWAAAAGRGQPQIVSGQDLAPLHGGSDAPVEARETASLAAMVVAILHGASIVRVHAVRPAVEAARIADAVLAAG